MSMRTFKGDQFTNGYPSGVKNTQDMKIRGTGAATKGTKFNSKPGRQPGGDPPTGPNNIYGR